jgi:carboxyl-terminal processing protease
MDDPDSALPNSRRPRHCALTTDDTMRQRVLPALAALFLALAVFSSAAPAFAQQAAPAASADRTAQLDDVLRRGYQLEAQRRWGEALAHYEDALRLFPQEPGLERRFELARLHYDLGRRYADRSYGDILVKLTRESALDLYSQVLAKIQTHYVEAPHWKELVERGTSNFELALGEPAFVERNVPERDRAAIEEFRLELRRVVGARTIATRQDARDAAAAAAALAQQRLEIHPQAAVMEYLCGATNALDPYSAYLTPDQLTEVYSQIEGNFVGLGVELKGQNGTLLIVRVITGSPAEQGGLRAGDRILVVDGQATEGLSTDQAANLLQGKEGSVAKLVVAAPDGPRRETSIRRQRIEVPSIDQARIVDRQQGIAYLKLTCFQKTTKRDLEAALWKLHQAGMRSLIIDLRGNPGGLLVTSVDVADLFLDRGTIVSTRGRSTQEDFTYTARQDKGTWRTPLVLIIDQDSASAAEIFAGAIRDHHRGTVVGVRSYGKGSVQGIFPLESSEAGVRLTTAKFYSPNGRPYSRVGVEPDVFVHQAARPIDGATASTAAPSGTAGGDAMLTAAVEAARGANRPR